MKVNMENKFTMNGKYEIEMMCCLKGWLPNVESQLVNQVEVYFLPAIIRAFILSLTEENT